MHANRLHITLRTADWALPGLRKFMMLSSQESDALKEKQDGTGVFFEGEISATNESKRLSAFWWVAFAIRMGLPQSWAVHGTGAALKEWLNQLDKATNRLFFRTCSEINLGKAQDGVLSLSAHHNEVVWRCFMTQNKVDRTPAFRGWEEESAEYIGKIAYEACAFNSDEAPRWNGMAWSRALLQSPEGFVLSMKDGTGSSWPQWLAAHTDGFGENPECWVGLLNAMEACGQNLDETNQLQNSLMHSIAFNGQTQQELNTVFEWGLSRGIRWDESNKKGFSAIQMAFHNPAWKKAILEEAQNNWPENFEEWKARWEAAALRQRVTGQQSKISREGDWAL